jgi:hypothetical protein
LPPGEARPRHPLDLGILERTRPAAGPVLEQALDSLSRHESRAPDLSQTAAIARAVSAARISGSTMLLANTRSIVESAT